MIKSFLIILLTISINALSQEVTLPLWPAGKVPNYQKTEEKEQSEINEILRISKVQEPNIKVFLPTKRNATGQAIVICPGGGYGILAYDWEGIEVAKWLNSKGIAAIVLKYRLPNSKSNIVPHLSPLMDVKRAIRLVRHHAGEWNIKTDKVGIMGFSAGGHLASTLGTHFDNGEKDSKDEVDRLSSRPDFMVLIYPVITMKEAYMHAGSRNNLIGEKPSAEMANLYSNDLQITTNTPQTFIIHAADDTAVPVENSLSFYKGLINNKVSAEMHIYPYGGHGFGLASGKGYLETWTDRCIDWLRYINK